MSSPEFDPQKSLELTPLDYTVPEIQQSLGSLSISPEVNAIIEATNLAIKKDPYYSQMEALCTKNFLESANSAFRTLDNPAVARSAQKRARLEAWQRSEEGQAATEIPVNLVLEELSNLDTNPMIKRLDRQIRVIEAHVTRQENWRKRQPAFLNMAEQLKPYLKRSAESQPSTANPPLSSTE